MMLPDLDREALRKGWTVALALTLPTAVIAWLVEGPDGRSGGSGLLTVVVLVGLFLGGRTSAKHQRRGTPLAHALMTTVGTVIALQVLRVGRLALLDRPLRLQTTVGNVLFGLVIGVISGLSTRQKAGNDNDAN